MTMFDIVTSLIDIVFAVARGFNSYEGDAEHNSPQDFAPLAPEEDELEPLTPEENESEPLAT